MSSIVEPVGTLLGEGTPKDFNDLGGMIDSIGASWISLISRLLLLLFLLELQEGFLKIRSVGIGVLVLLDLGNKKNQEKMCSEITSIGTWSSNETEEIVQIINQKAIRTSRFLDNGA